MFPILFGLRFFETGIHVFMLLGSGVHALGIRWSCSWDQVCMLLGSGVHALGIRCACSWDQLFKKLVILY
jgi:hypothetical protein